MTSENPFTQRGGGRTWSQATVVSAGVHPGDMVVVRVPQGCDMTVSIELDRSPDISLALASPACEPRQAGGGTRGTGTSLPHGLVDKLGHADRRVSDWLLADDANPELFFSRPVEALKRAGVELSRAEQKTLLRAHQAFNEAAVVGPGVRVAGLSVSMRRRNRAGEPGREPGPVSGSLPGPGRSDDCGCGSRERR